MPETHLPELVVLTLLPGPGVGSFAGAGKSVHNLLVEDGHSQVEHPHDQDEQDTGECPQLQDGAVRPHIRDGGAQQAVPAAPPLSGAVHWSLGVGAGGKESLLKDVLFFCLERPAAGKAGNQSKRQGDSLKGCPLLLPAEACSRKARRGGPWDCPLQVTLTLQRCRVTMMLA